MKSAIALIAVVGFAAVGCSSKTTRPSVTDISTPTNTYEPMQPTQPIASAQPVIYDAPQTYSANSTGGTGMVSGGTYTIRKGDTLYSIAKSKYGDGKQWQKIASANPGVNPNVLKVGQTITLP